MPASSLMADLAAQLAGYAVKLELRLVCLTARQMTRVRSANLAISACQLRQLRISAARAITALIGVRPPPQASAILVSTAQLVLIRQEKINAQPATIAKQVRM